MVSEKKWRIGGFQRVVFRLDQRYYPGAVDVERAKFLKDKYMAALIYIAVICTLALLVQIAEAL